MLTIKAFIKSHPLISFYALAFAFTWGGLIMVVGGPQQDPWQPGSLRYLGSRSRTPAGLAGPSVASILMTGILNGRKGLRDLFARMTRWRVGVRWYAVPLLTAPLVFTAIFFALSLTSSDYLPGILAIPTKMPFCFRVSSGLWRRHLRGAGLDGLRHTYAA